MGGPIKQGIMQGIREPYKDGNIVGGHQSPALAGAHPWKDKSGREHHVIPALWAGAAGLARFAPSIYRAAQTALRAGKFGRSYNLGRIGGAGSGAAGASGGFGTAALPTSRALTVMPKAGMGSRFMGALPPWLRTSLERDPVFKGGKWIKEAIMGPTAKSFGKKIVQGATTPTGAVTIGYFGGKWLWPDGTEATDKEVKKELSKKKGDKDYGPYTKGKPTITAAMREEKAKADKEKRINELLDTMGYDKSRKDAAYNALIDAGRLVSERGSLKGKDIGRELIDPIVAATSARFDKPQQIREAVGLMKVKADIAKQLEDPQVKELRRLEIEKGEKALAGDSFKDILAKRALKAEAPRGEDLAHILRTSEGIDAVVLPIEIPAGHDALEVATETIKETWTNPEVDKIDPGYYVVSNRVIIVDEQGNVTPYIPT